MLNIIQGRQNGSSLALQSGVSYTVANEFGSDIYVDCGLTHKVRCDFTIINNDNVIFNAVSDDFLLESNEPIKNSINYLLPLKIKCGDTIFEILNLTPSENIEKNQSSIETDNANIKSTKESSLETISEDLLNNLPLLDRNVEANELDALFKDIPIDSSASKTNYWHSLKNRILGLRSQYKLNAIFRRFLSYQAILRDKIVKFYAMNPFVALIVFGGIGLIITIILVAWASSMTFESPSSQTHSLYLEKGKIQKKLVLLPKEYSHVKLIMNRDSLILNGVVESMEQVKYLSSVFESYSPQFKNKVKYFAEIEPIIRKILLENKMPLRYGFDSKNGSVFFKGIVQNVKFMDNTIIDINNQLPMLFGIDNSLVFSQYEIESDMNKILLNADFKQNLFGDLNVIKNKLNIYGYLPSNKMEKLNQLLISLKNKYQEVISIDVDIADITKSIPFKIVEVYTGNTSYIVTSQGKTVFPGGALNGITLVSISNSQLVFQGKHKLIINLADLFSISSTKQEFNFSQRESARNNIILEEFQRVTKAIEDLQNDLSGLRELQKTTSDLKAATILNKHILSIESEIMLQKHNRTLLEHEVAL